MRGIIGIVEGMGNGVVVFYIRVIIGKRGGSEMGWRGESDGGSDEVRYVYVVVVDKEWVVDRIKFGIDRESGSVVV